MTQKFDERDDPFPNLDLGASLVGGYRVLQRRFRLIALCMMIGAALAVAYALLADPRYTASASIIIDPRIDGSPNGPDTPSLIMTVDALIVDSEVKVLRSREVTGRAAAAMGLYESAELREPGIVSRMTTRLRQLLGSSGSINPETSDQIRREQIRRGFVEALKIQRSEDTFVIDVFYTSKDREFAAEAVNAVVRAYLSASFDRRNSDLDRLNAWLGDRLTGLEAELVAAESEIARFRKNNQLFELRDGRLTSELELTSATETLINTRNAIVALGVKIEQLTQQIELGDVRSVSLAPEDRTVALTAFEARYTELLQDEMTSALSRGADSTVVRELRVYQDQTRGLIMEELRQIRSRMLAQRETLQRRVSEIESAIETLRADANADAENMIDLRRIERQAEAKRRLYEQFLASFNTSSAMSSFDGSPARVIAWAVPPDRKSEPKSTMLVVVSTFGALVLGVSAAFLRETLDHSVRTPDDLRSATGLNFLGAVPLIRNEMQRMRELGMQPTTSRQSGSWQKLGRKQMILRFAADNPRSIMAETLRSLQIQLEWRKQATDAAPQPAKAPDQRGKVVGFVSTVSGEGKTTLATNMATLLAQNSARTILVDLDLLKTDLSRQISAIVPATNTLSNLVMDGSASAFQPLPELEGLTVVVNDGSVDLNPAVGEDANELAEMLERLRDEYEWIIVDLPPLLGVAETVVLATLCDRVAFVAQWGVTQKSELKIAVRHLQNLGDRVVGTIFSKIEINSYLKYNADFVKGIYY
ncbi:MAG: AAA family ATPase [Rhodobacteraceae bacterium]|nr:AAA family ATPase [Paracoccaceae bacterium]